MISRWHSDRKVGEVAILPNGTKVRIVSIRGRRVRLEYLDPRREPEAGAQSPSPHINTSVPPHTPSDRRHPAERGG